MWFAHSGHSIDRFDGRLIVTVYDKAPIDLQVKLAGETIGLANFTCKKMVSHLPNTSLVAAFEHDGLFIWCDPSLEPRSGWDVELKDTMNTQDTTMSVSLKPIPTAEELFEHLRALEPDRDWDTIDEQWDTQLDLVRQARPGIARGREDRLYAEIVAHEQSTYDHYQWHVRELFKHDRAGTYWVSTP